MKPIPTAILVGVLVVLGKWARDKSPNIDNAIGVAGVAIGLAMIESVNAKLAHAFGTLIFVSVLIVHFPKIVKETGLAK